FIDHNAHAMEASELLQEVTDQTLAAIDERWPAPEDVGAPEEAPTPTGAGLVVTFTVNGWVEYVEHEALFGLVPPGGVVKLETGVGRYAVAGVPLAVLWPPPDDPERAIERAREAISLGRTRTLAQDPSYGVRQLADVGIRALSPGVDDPTTAQDAIFHIAAVLREMHHRVPPPRVAVDDRERTLVQTEGPSHRELVELAFDELRRSTSTHPAVAAYLLEALSLLCRAEAPPAPNEAREAMNEQARLVVDGVMREDLLDHDKAWVRSAYERRFGPFKG